MMTQLSVIQGQGNGANGELGAAASRRTRRHRLFSYFLFAMASNFIPLCDLLSLLRRHRRWNAVLAASSAWPKGVVCQSELSVSLPLCSSVSLAYGISNFKAYSPTTMLSMSFCPGSVYIVRVRRLSCKTCPGRGSQFALFTG